MELVVKKLAHAGLSEKEAYTYLAAIMLGRASAQEIAQKANINRTTAYVILESLVKQGLLSRADEPTRQIFVAEHPERLLNTLRVQRECVDEHERELRRVLPNLLSFFHVQTIRPVIRVLEGEAGFQTVRDELLRSGERFVEWVPIADALKLRPVRETRERHWRELRERGITFRSLVVMDEPDWSCLPELPNTEIRIVSAEQFPIHGEMIVQANRVYLFSHAVGVFAIVIQSQELANTLGALFELAWNGASGCPSKVF